MNKHKMTINTTLFNEFSDGQSQRSCPRIQQHRYGLFFSCSDFFFSCSRVLKLDSVNRKCDTMTHVTRRDEG